MSLQARVAADVLGVVHPARRNLTFSRALDVRENFGVFFFFVFFFLFFLLVSFFSRSADLSL